MCESDRGYVVNSEIYTRAADIIETDLGITGNIVLRLLISCGLASRHHILVMDRYYNSISLATDLMNEYKTGVVGTILSNRKQKGIPRKRKCRRAKVIFVPKKTLHAWYGKIEDPYISYQTTMTPTI